VGCYKGGGWGISLKVLDPIDPETFGSDVDALALRAFLCLTYYSFDTLQHTATHCDALRHTATLCSALPHSAKHNFISM